MKIHFYLFCAISAWVFSYFLPESITKYLFFMSMLIKDVIFFLIPFFIFIFISVSLYEQIHKNRYFATYILIMIFTFEFFSICLTSSLAYGYSTLLPIKTMEKIQDFASHFQLNDGSFLPFHLNIPSFWNASLGIYAGMIFGFYMACCASAPFIAKMYSIKCFVEKHIFRTLLKIFPLFIFGLFIHTSKKDISFFLNNLFVIYSLIFALVFLEKI